MKGIFKFFAWLLLILAVVIVVVVLSLDFIVKYTVNNYGDKVTKTEVTLGGVSTSLLNLDAELRDFIVGSPEGFASPNMFKMGRIAVDVDSSTIMSDTIIVNRVDISDVLVTYEVAGGRSNLTALMENLTGGKTSSTPVAQPAEKKESTRKVIIRELNIRNAQVALAANMGLPSGSPAGMTISLPDITVHNIGEEKKSTSIEETIASILEIFTTHTIKGVANSAFNGITDAGKGAINTIKRGFRSLFGN